MLMVICLKLYPLLQARDGAMHASSAPPPTTHNLNQMMSCQLYPIQKPPGHLSKPKGGGYSLKLTLSWDQMCYKSVQNGIHELCNHFFDICVPYKAQYANNQLCFVKEARKKLPILDQYASAWPTEEFAMMYLKNTSDYRNKYPVDAADDPRPNNSCGHPTKHRHEQNTGPQKAARMLDHTVAPPQWTRPRPCNTSPDETMAEVDEDTPSASSHLNGGNDSSGYTESGRVHDPVANMHNHGSLTPSKEMDEVNGNAAGPSTILVFVNPRGLNWNAEDVDGDTIGSVESGRHNNSTASLSS
ncbi:hypothetical protein L208DRAFT_1378539 [Tricholoma matsutake]|nr:hypothetical protein L208DRAFT_1378539 [Tricholoma matsutake 945]